MTRHNMGYLMARAYAEWQQMPLKENKQLYGITAKGEILGTGMHVLLPTTYMNESGQAVRKYLDYYKLNVSDLLVVCDDVDLPFGQLRLREKGSPGGHNGLKSIERHLGTNNYARLKVGIGRSLAPDQILSDYVLDKFNAEEQEQLPALLIRGTQGMQQLLTDSFANAMNVVNKIENKKDK